MRVFIGVLNGALILLMSTAAIAQEAVHYTSRAGFVTPALALSAAIIMAVAVLGGTIAQGKAARSALEGIARNPEAAGKLITPMIISLTLIESLVIFSFVLAILLQLKI